MIINTLYRVSADTTPPSHTINNLTNIQLRILNIKINYRREIFFRKEFQSLSWVHTTIPNLDGLNTRKKNSQVQDPYSIYQVPPQQEEHTDLEKSMESMIQFPSDPFDMIEARLSRLENMRRNEETLPT